MDTKFLKEVAQFIGASKIEQELNLLSSKEGNCPLVLPVMGEFSSGKTTMINALTDNKQLETAAKPTTATIYEVHFCCDNCCAKIYYADDKVIDVEDIADLHNDEIADAMVVEVFDTSKKVPSSIILVDTPGLSSPDPRHKQTLVDFLPKADGILLVSDINQPGLTKSLTDFIKTMELSNRRIYLILTKCDTKSEKEVIEAKRYIETNNGIKQSNIVAVSSKDNNLTELLDLLSRIQKDKSEILEQVNKQRLISIAKQLLGAIDIFKKASDSDDKLENAIAEQELKLSKINNSIQKLISSLKDDIEEVIRKSERNFEDAISGRLESLVANKGADFDTEAVSIINNSASLIVSNICAEIQSLVRVRAAQSNGDVDFPSLDNVDLSKFSVDGLQYNLNLNTLGHEYDGMISKGLKITAAIAATAYVASKVTASAAADAAGGASAAADAAGGASAAGTATYGTTDAIIDVAQTAAIIGKGSENKYQANTNRGIVDSVVGLVTDNTLGKPQRRRAVHEYIDNTLMPTFKASVRHNCDTLLRNIHNSLLDDATITISEIKNSLNKLKEEKTMQENDFRARMKTLNDYSITLNNEYLCGNF